jgi:DNA-binding response OmpR family regulator
MNSQSAQQASACAKGTVLLVDNETRDLEYHAKILRAEGYGVVTCDSYSNGFSLIHERRFDLVFVSQGGLYLEGLAVLKHAIATDRRMPIIVLARPPHMHCYLEAMQLGAVDYLEKPVSPGELLLVVRTHLRRGAVA